MTQGTNMFSFRLSITYKITRHCKSLKTRNSNLKKVLTLLLVIVPTLGYLNGSVTTPAKMERSSQL
jgi:hypothetical protein